jgi:nucleoside 2-deoxyribosyltransferase
MKIYLAGPLFSEFERDWIQKLRKEIESLAASHSHPFQAIWHHDLITQSEIESLGKKARLEIFNRC